MTDDRCFDHEHTVEFQTRRDSVRVDGDRQRELLVHLLPRAVVLVSPAAALERLRYHPQSGARAACLDQQTVGVDVAVGGRQRDGHQKTPSAPLVVCVDLPHSHGCIIIIIIIILILTRDKSKRLHIRKRH